MKANQITQEQQVELDNRSKAEKLRDKMEQLVAKVRSNRVLSMTINGGLLYVPAIKQLEHYNVSQEDHKEAVDCMNALKSSYWQAGGKLNSYRVSNGGKGCSRTEGTRLDLLVHSILLDTSKEIKALKEAGNREEAEALCHVLSKVVTGESDGKKQWGYRLAPSYQVMSLYLSDNKIKVCGKRSFHAVREAFLRDVRGSEWVDSQQATEAVEAIELAEALNEAAA